MIPEELVKQIRLLEIRTNRMVDEISGGAYRSVFKGAGIEFEEVREYTVEDDARTIDWNVSARMGAPFVKKFVEERELNVMLLVDVSSSGAFGSAAKSKRQSAAELAALIAFSASRNHDKVSLMMFSDKIELYVPPRSGRRHTLRLIREMLAFAPQSKGTDIDLALRESSRLLKKSSVVFLISDFIDGKDFSTSLKQLNRRHDVIAVQLYDPSERSWPIDSSVVIEDAETGELVFFDAGARKKLQAEMDSSVNAVAALCRSARVDRVEIETGSDVLGPLIQFYALRNNRNKH
ncbi:MAG: DUF58 domain-containing protein [Lentisphaeria bacterium]|nr:DUF58 domain-containing protein [Lentisphaeria bacterium]